MIHLSRIDITSNVISVLPEILVDSTVSRFFRGLNFWNPFPFKVSYLAHLHSSRKHSANCRELSKQRLTSGLRCAIPIVLIERESIDSISFLLLSVLITNQAHHYLSRHYRYIEIDFT